MRAGIQHLEIKNDHGRDAGRSQYRVFRDIENPDFGHGYHGPMEDKDKGKEIYLFIERHQHAEHVKGYGTRQHRSSDFRELETAQHGNRRIREGQDEHDDAPWPVFSGLPERRKPGQKVIQPGGSHQTPENGHDIRVFSRCTEFHVIDERYP